MVLEVAVMSGFSKCPNDFCTVHAFLAQEVDELALTSPVSIDGHVKSQRPVREEHRPLFVPSNISQVSGCSKVTVHNRMMKTGLLWRLLLARD
ncbi:hypothetical protein CDAR_622351 [Caerostris darwini]|uniref:Uncharacterized protein n=1 Tax=Caerostris darwini TaxID=1538125 RepID=A0AAV4W4P1_9ARAC|nr:hypothetical protein CDAR_622351 [Caerostris darwini]